jgi:hypothetical protein
VRCSQQCDSSSLTDDVDAVAIESGPEGCSILIPQLVDHPLGEALVWPENEGGPGGTALPTYVNDEARVCTDEVEGSTDSGSRVERQRGYDGWMERER